VLYLPAGTREHFLNELARVWPEEAKRYESLYASAYLTPSQSKARSAAVTKLGERLGIADRRLHPLEPPPDPEQLMLFAS
jgi:hypothetical protein